MWSFRIISFAPGAFLGGLSEFRGFKSAKIEGHMAPYDPGRGAGSKNFNKK